jgi:hypothetical protein
MTNEVSWSCTIKKNHYGNVVERIDIDPKSKQSTKKTYDYTYDTMDGYKSSRTGSNGEQETDERVYQKKF